MIITRRVRTSDLVSLQISNLLELPNTLPHNPIESWRSPLPNFQLSNSKNLKCSGWKRLAYEFSVKLRPKRNKMDSNLHSSMLAFEGTTCAETEL